MADLGWDVLDANVEVTTSVLQRRPSPQEGIFVDCRSSKSEKKETLLVEVIRNFSDGIKDRHVSMEQSLSFKKLPNAVIGYDFPDFLRVAFNVLPSLEEVGFKANVGHQLKAEKHFRLWWEIASPSTTGFFSRMFNGAGFAPYLTPLYDFAIADSDLDLLFKDSSTVLRNKDSQFLPGVCFGKRGEFFCTHVLPRGHIFTVEGQSIPVKSDVAALDLLCLLNTPLVRMSLNKYCGQHKYSGYVNLFPYRELSNADTCRTKVNASITSTLIAQSHDELHPLFSMHQCESTIAEYATKLDSVVNRALDAVLETERYCHLEAMDTYQVKPAERNLIEAFKEKQPRPDAAIKDADTESNCKWLAVYSSFSHAIGIVFGRWDIRYSTGERPTLELPNPFKPLPVCPPGMLQDDDGLPLGKVEGRRLRDEGKYPLDVAWDGILVDDPEHPLDLERRVRAALAVVWGDRLESIEQEACSLLNVKALRDWFRKPAGFFADHLKRYSKSRRQAPIYWPLSTASGSYTLWIYYHRLDSQTLYFAVNNFVEPKLNQVTKDATQLRQKTGRSRDDESQLEQLSNLEGELTDFRIELLRIAAFWKPNLNDGVEITAAPLWRLFRLPKWQKTLRENWEKMEAGDYDWAHLALSIWPERVVRVAHKDRSIAIAHSLEDQLWHEAELKTTDKKGKVKSSIKWQPRDLSEAQLDAIVVEVKKRESQS